MFRTPAQRILTLSLLALLLGPSAHAQLWYYDFAGSTGTQSAPSSSTSFFTPPEGTARVNLADGSATLADPGSTLGAGSEFQLAASSGSGLNKVALTDYPGGITSYLKFDLRFEGGTDGYWHFYAGNGGSFASGNTVNPSEAMTGIRWTLTGGTLTAEVHTAGGWVALPAGVFSKDANFTLEIFANNAAEDLYYEKNGGYMTPMGSADIWVNGVLIGDDLPRLGLPPESEIDSWAFYGTGNTSGSARLMMDNILYSNDMTMKFILPVRIGSLEYKTEPIGVRLSWSADGEEGGEQFRVERSGEGLHFTEVGRVSARKAPGRNEYTFLDATAGYGAYYYRVRVRTAGGKDLMSPIVRTDRSGSPVSLSAYPNPVTERVIRLPMGSLPAGNYTLTLSTSGAREVLRRSVSGGRGTETVALPAEWPAGHYFLHLQGNGQTVLHQMLVVQ